MCPSNPPQNRRSRPSRCGHSNAGPWADATGSPSTRFTQSAIPYVRRDGKLVANNFWPGNDVASTAQTSIVADIIPCTGSASPTFIAQSDSTGVAFADIGQTCDVTLGTGSAFTGQSGAYLSNLGTTATLPFRIVGLYGGLPGAGGFMGVQPGSGGPYSGSATGAYNWVIVRANVTGAGATGI